MHTNPQAVLVFLGPSLLAAEASKLCPAARLLPPIRCGDIARALRLSPSVIAIVDGVYERVPAVWHKEIVLAIAEGVAVIGGASMGALRAAELAVVGMEGVGAIYERFRDGLLEDDDEVAVVHGHDSRPLNHPMVNLRFTVEAATAQQILDSRVADQLIAAAKATFYADRQLGSMVENAISAGAPAEQCRSFRRWAEAGGYVEQKALDARAVLARAKTLGQQRVPTRSYGSVATAGMRRLLRDVDCQPFAEWHDWLPRDEKVALAARLLGDAYREVRRLAQLLGVLAACGRSLQPHSAPDRLARQVKLLLAIESRLLPSEQASSPMELLSALRGRDAVLASALEWTVTAWATIDETLSARGAQVREEEIAIELNRVRRTLRLFSSEATTHWLTKLGFDAADLTEAARMSAVYRFIITGFQVDVVGDFPRRRWWLLEALHLTGAYARATALLAAPPRAITTPGDDEALALDFRDGAVGWRRDLERMFTEERS